MMEAVVSPDDSAALVHLLAEVFPPDDGGRFDRALIPGSIWHPPELVDALAFLGVRRRTSGWNRGYLTKASAALITKWLCSVEGTEFAGLRLERDELGWYRVVRTGDAGDEPGRIVIHNPVA